MKRNRPIHTFLLMFVVHVGIFGQGQWPGTYAGQVNGDNAIMVLVADGTGKLKGSLKDTYQTFKIVADVNGNRMAGDAIEESLGLSFGLLGELKGDEAHMKLVVSLLGQTSETPFLLKRQTNSKSTPSTKVQTQSLNVSPTNLDSRVIGSWTKNETYNSGYGSNFMGANFSQRITFLADGRLVEGGSSATVSGSNYSGSSSGNGGAILEGVTWFNKGKNLHLKVVQNGQTQEVLLGSYYIENGRMLITGQDGTKLLLTKG